MNRPCSVEGCGSPVLAKGLCQKHYERLRRTGSLELRTRNRSMCAECGLREGLYIAGEDRICQVCYRRARAEAARARRAPGVCAFCGKRFERNRSDQAFCSRACKEKKRRADGRVAEANRKRYYKSRYGLTVEQVEQMRADGCAICGTRGGTGRWGALHIDHDHVTGAVRGVLCSPCNTALGHMEEDPVRLRAAADYLEKAPMSIDLTPA